MNIGIFGGSFNPPHKMHENMALFLLEHHYLDKVIFVPTGIHYEYKNNLINEKDRFNMLNIIANKHVNMEVSNYELKDNVVHTIDTLKYFQEKYPNDSIYFICGADNLSYIDKWHNGDDILSNYKILVIRRNSNNIDDILMSFAKYKDNIIVVDIEEQNISSSMIRSNIEEYSNLLDKDVLKYIQDNKLYGEYYE